MRKQRRKRAPCCGPRKLLFRYHFALCLKIEKNFADAEKEAHHALVLARKCWGDEHPNTKLLERLIADVSGAKP